MFFLLHLLSREKNIERNLIFLYITYTVCIQIQGGFFNCSALKGEPVTETPCMKSVDALSYWQPACLKQFCEIINPKCAAKFIILGNILVETHHETSQAPFLPLISVTDMASNGSSEKCPHDRIYIA